jgi:PAS domain S-box-containing protein
MIGALVRAGTPAGAWVPVNVGNLILAGIVLIVLAVALLAFRQLLNGICAAYIRDLKKTNDALTESQRLLHLHYDNAPDMMLSLDVETQKIVRCNETVARRLGYSKAELLGMARSDLYAPPCRHKADRAFREMMANGQINDVELQALCKDGRVIDVSVSAVQYRDAQGHIRYSDATWRDISQRKLADAQASKREMQLTTLYLLGEQLLLKNNLSALMHNVAYSLFQTLSVRCVLIGDLCFEDRGLIMQVAIGVPRQFLRGVEPYVISPLSLPAKVLATGGPLHLSARSCPQWLDGMQCLAEVAPDNGVATVLRDSQGNFGLLMAFHEAGKDFIKEDIDYIQSLTNLLSVAAERNRSKEGVRSGQVAEAGRRVREM